MSTTVSLAINGMSCGQCVASVQRALRKVPGVERADVHVGHADLTLRHGDVGAIAAAAAVAVSDAGYEASVTP